LNKIDAELARKLFAALVVQEEDTRGLGALKSVFFWAGVIGTMAKRETVRRRAIFLAVVMLKWRFI